MPAKSDGSIQVLHKAVAVLELLSVRGELTVVEIAEATAEPRSSMYRLLASLEQLGLVEPGSRKGTHKLGLGLLRLGSAVVAGYDERRAGLPAMEELHQKTGETVFLCVKRDNVAVCIERLEGERVQSLALKLGGSLPLHIGAAPRVLLAFEPTESWEAYWAAGQLEPYTPNTLIQKRALFQSLEEIRETGIAISDEDVTPGIAAVGAPIRDYNGQVRGALSISGTRPAIIGNRERSVELVREAAERASHALGYRDPAVSS